MSHRATVRQLESDFADAMQRMYAVGNGLARLRAQLDHEAAMAARGAIPPQGAGVAPRPTGTGTPGPAGPATSAPPAAPPPAAPPGPAWPGAALPGPVPPGPPAYAPAPAGLPIPPSPSGAAPARPPWYRREGMVTRALAIAGAVVTLIGVAMLLVIAVQQGWFGPISRVTAGGLLAGTLMILGVMSAKLDRSRSGSVGSVPVALVATGAAAAYLDVVAVTSGYRWVPPAMGLGLAGVVAAGGLHLARRWSSELLAVLLVVGAAVLAPVVAGGFDWQVTAFLAVLTSLGWWAGGRATRPYLTLARSTLAALALLIAAASGLASSASADLRGHLAVGAVLTLVTLATSAISVRRDRADITSSIAVGAVAVGTIAVAAATSDPLRPAALAAVGAVLLLAAAAFTRPPFGPLSGHLVGTAAVAGTVAGLLAAWTGSPDRLAGTGLLVLALAYAAAAAVRGTRFPLGVAVGVAAVALLAWARHPLAILTEGSAISHDLGVAIVDSVLVGALVGTGGWAISRVRTVSRDLRVLGAVAGWALGLASSATLVVSTTTLVGIRVESAGLGFITGHAVATVAWMVAAAWLLGRGLTGSRHADLALRTGLLLSAVAVAKLFLFDLASLSGVVRSIAFIVTGLLLLATGSSYARAHQRRAAP
jgi:hypothetical protein